MDKYFLCREALKTISAERFNAFKDRADSDDLNALSRYFWNVSLCEALYPCLQVFEVTLRNIIHSTLSLYYNTPYWFNDSKLLRPQEYERVLDAGDVLKEQGKPIEPGRIVAELNLGFWTSLFVAAYDRSIAIPVMNRGLRGFPSFVRNRRTLSQRFEDVRYLRNRVFHYEPIWYWMDLPKRHQAIVDSIGFISPTTGNLLSLVDRFDQVHKQGWQHYRQRIEAELLTVAPPNQPADKNTTETGE